MNDFERAKRFIKSHEWRFAKSMASIPHWYCLLSERNDRDRFTWFVRFIRENSREGVFYGRRYRYFYLNGYKYWDMDPTPEVCDLVNRDQYKKDFVSEAPYAPAPYDIFFENAIRQAIAGKIKEGCKVADLNCGCGQLLDSIRIEAENYSGVDFRKNAVLQFRENRPGMPKRIWLEKVANLSYENFDIVVSLNAELLDGEDLKRIVNSRKTSAGVFLFSRGTLAPFEGLNLLKTDEFSLLTTEKI